MSDNGQVSKVVKTSPFVTMWYGYVGRYTEGFYRWWIKRGWKECGGLELSCSEYFIPQAFKDSSDRTRRKARKKRKRRDHGDEDVQRPKKTRQDAKQ